MAKTEWISFNRNDFIIAQRTVVLDKSTDSKIMLPSADFACKIKWLGNASVEYNGGIISDEVKSKCKKCKMDIPSVVTINLYRKKTVFEVPFKKRDEKLVIVQIRIKNPEAIETLLSRLPGNKYVSDGYGGGCIFYLLEHYDTAQMVRGLADYVHDMLCGIVHPNISVETINAYFKEVGLDMEAERVTTVEEE